MWYILFIGFRSIPKYRYGLMMLYLRILMYKVSITFWIFEQGWTSDSRTDGCLVWLDSVMGDVKVFVGFTMVSCSSVKQTILNQSIEFPVGEDCM